MNLHRCPQITAPLLPGAVFFSIEALAEFVPERQRYEDACRTLAVDDDRDAFAEILGGLGYEWIEIKAHFDRPRYRIRQGFYA